MPETNEKSSSKISLVLNSSLPTQDAQYGIAISLDSKYVYSASGVGLNSYTIQNSVGI